MHRCGLDLLFDGALTERVGLLADLDEAVRWARKIPIPGKGAVEVRPVWQD